MDIKGTEEVRNNFGLPALPPGVIRKTPVFLGTYPVQTSLLSATTLSPTSSYNTKGVTVLEDLS